MKLPELLAPAASFSVAQAAFDHGADAVYAGCGNLNLRAHSINFSASEIADLCSMAHDKGKKVYGALNVMPSDDMLCDVAAIVQAIHKLPHRVDAYIVSDPGVFSLCKKHTDIPLHLSTQTGTFNAESARFWAAQGIRRVILPRELTVAQIAFLTKQSGVETEVFVHGAMCVSVSGRCLLGAYRGMRHPNFGDCPQPCRLQYSIAPVFQSGPPSEEFLTIEEYIDEKTAYVLNSKDLNALPILDRIVESGVSSLKIEGRNRSVHYVSSVVSVYRAALDSMQMNRTEYSVKASWKEELERLDHRPYTTGFYGTEMILQDIRNERLGKDYRVVGVVREIQGEKGPIVDVKNPFNLEDTVSVLPGKIGSEPFDATVVDLRDANGNRIGCAKTNRLVYCKTEPALCCGDILRKKGIAG